MPPEFTAMPRAEDRVDTFRSDTELLRFLRRSAVPRGGHLAVVAGQFALMFDEKSHHLLPMIWQDADDVDTSHWVKYYAGDFPVRTFKLGARFLHYCAVSSSAQTRPWRSATFRAWWPMTI